jgi:hypothetical protein
MGKKQKQRLPKKILPMPNKDKIWHERWKKNRDMLNIPHPYRAVLLGPPNCGKGCITKNLIIRAKPDFEEIYCVHLDAQYTKEWEEVDAKMLSEIPEPDQWVGEVKTLVILDDLDFKQATKKQKMSLDRLFGYVSTHKNISVILCAQDTFSVPPIVRRCSNLWILWKINDLDSLANMARKTGLKADNFNTIFTELCCGSHDSLWIDTTDKTPYPLRKNGYTLITKEDGEESTRMLKKLDHFTTTD